MSRVTARRRLVALGLAALLITASGAGLIDPPAARAQALTATTVTVSVVSVTPATPGALTAPSPLDIVLRLTNTGDQSLDDVELRADRGDPIGGHDAQQAQAALDAAIAKPEPPDPSEDSPVKDANGNPLKITTSLPAEQATTVRIRTSTSLINEVGVCICAVAAIYPLWFSVDYTDPQSGQTTLIGTGQTLLPAFEYKPQPVQVSWLWPIIEAPHRLGDGNVFLNDELASSVITGRLGRLLQVADAVTRQVPMTLVVDPELIDELAVMSSGAYYVEQGSGHIPGVGSAAAATWLAALRSILRRRGVELDFTAPADADVQSLTDNGLQWSSTLPAAEQAAVVTALGTTGHTEVDWPINETLDSGALSALVEHGVNTVVLNDATLPGGSYDTTSTDALAPVTTSAGSLTAAVTSSSIERFVAPVLSINGTGLSQLPELVSEVAIRAVADPTQSHYVVITPPRTVDPAPATAAAAILATTDTSWAQALPLDAATNEITPVGHGSPVTTSATTALPEQLITDIQQLLLLQPALASILPADEASIRLGWVPAVITNLESSAWRSAPRTGVSRAEQALKTLEAVADGVFIVRPSSGTYTLGSSNAPLPLTLQNTLAYPVTVDVSVSSQLPGVLGFSADAVRAVTVPARGKLSLRVPTHVVRTGRFEVTAGLFTPVAHQPVGQAVPLTVHSTALGVIGVVITIVAGAVLLLALLIRFFLLLRRRHRRTGAAPRAPVPQ